MRSGHTDCPNVFTCRGCADDVRRTREDTQRKTDAALATLAPTWVECRCECGSHFIPRPTECACDCRWMDTWLDDADPASLVMVRVKPGQCIAAMHGNA